MNKRNDDKFKGSGYFNMKGKKERSRNVNKVIVRRFFGKQFTYLVFFLFFVALAFVSGFFGAKMDGYLTHLSSGASKIPNNIFNYDDRCISKNVGLCGNVNEGNAVIANDKYIGNMIQRTSQGVVDISGVSHSTIVTSGGSGCLVRVKGTVYIITNCHVIDDVRQKSGSFYVTIGPKEDEKEKKKDLYKVTLVGYNRDADVAVFEFASEIDEEKLYCLEYAKDADMQLGRDLYTLGFPSYANGRMVVTKGVLSAQYKDTIGKRNNENNKRKVEIVMTDASTNKGNSGGPLINVKGELVGLNTAVVFSTESILGQDKLNNVFEAVSVKELKPTIERIVDKKTKPGLGIICEDCNQGVRVLDFADDNSAAKMDGFLKKGDIITKVDGVPIKDVKHLTGLIQNRTVKEKDYPKLDVKRPSSPNINYVGHASLNYVDQNQGEIDVEDVVNEKANVPN